jgi:hypothetical protein
MPAFPEMPSSLREALPPEFWNWWQAYRTYMLTTLFTNQDITAASAGKGLVLTNAGGDVTKRIRLNDAGTGIIIEDV